MSNFEIATNIEGQIGKLKSAHAILLEVIHSLDKKISPDSAEAYMFIGNLEHYSLLLFAVNDYLSEFIDHNQNTVESLLNCA